MSPDFRTSRFGLGLCDREGAEIDEQIEPALNWREKPDPVSFIYLIECVPVGIYKIGYAQDPIARTQDLEHRTLGPARYRYGLSWHEEVKPWQSASCKPYRLLWYAPADDHRAAELTLHKRFADKRIEVEGWRGPEWFTLAADDIDQICSIERFEGGTAITDESE